MDLKIKQLLFVLVLGLSACTSDESSGVVQKNPAKAQQLFEQTVADHYNDNGDFKKATALYLQAIELHPDPPADYYYYLGHAYTQRLHLGSAIESFSKAIDKQPNDPLYYLERAKAYNLYEKNELAIQDIEKGLALTEPGSEGEKRLQGFLDYMLQ